MIWDLYDEKFNNTLKTIKEQNANDIPNGLYHLTMNIWIINSKKEVLLFKKIINYNLVNPGLWTSINGNVLSGESSFEAIKRILSDKIGLIVSNKSKIIELGKDLRNPHHYIYNTYVIYEDVDVKKLSINKNYYSKLKWADYDEINNMISNGEIEYPLIDRINKYILPNLQSK